jgi:signal transduction histidine kinase
MENVLLNLGINATQTIKEEGIITFCTEYDSRTKRIRIAVSDTGTGIPAEKLEDVFKPFFTMRTEGTGLGLAIAKEIIEMHQGEIWVENNPKKGCTFNIILPA